MRLGEVVPGEGPDQGKPLDGIRVLAAEQMQALPYATQLLGRLGAEVVKVEHPVHGESGRGASPAMIDPEGRTVGATFLRNNLSQAQRRPRPEGPRGPRALPRPRAASSTSSAENFKAGTMDRLGLGYEDVKAVDPSVIYLSVSGLRQHRRQPVPGWPAYASIVEAMSGIYAWAQRPGEPPRPNPIGRARRHQQRAVRRHRRPRRAAPPRPHRRRPVRRHRHARRHGGHDRRRVRTSGRWASARTSRCR